MNVFLNVTLKTLSRNKTRTLVTIIGIILSAAMLTAVTSFVTSLRCFMTDVAIYENGDWHGGLYSVGSGKIRELESNPEVLHVAACENIGYSALSNPKYGSSPYIFVIGADSSFNSIMPVHITKGRLPETADEIILPVHLVKNGGTEFSVGDRITLDIGVRMYENTILNQQTAFIAGEDGKAGEELVIKETRTYTVVGFYERPSFESFTSPGYTAITVMDGTVQEGRTYDVYFKLKKPSAIYSFIREEQQKEGYAGSTYNDDLLMYSGVSKYLGFYTVLYSLTAILVLLIMAGSVSLIYNAFSISVSERTKQIGLLSSVGATHRQIRKCILYEAMFVSVIGIPLGILSGLAGIGVTLSIVGQRLTSLYSGDVPYSLSLHVNIWTIIAAVLLAVVTVLVSAWIPARRATRITAMEAIRQTKDINVKAKDVRTSKLTYRLFGLEGMLARKHFRRNRKRYRTTVVSLFMSIVLFISASSFCSYLKDSVTDVLKTRDYDIRWVYNTRAYTEMTPRQVYEMLAQTDGITDSVYAYVEIGNAYVEGEDIRDEFKERFGGSAGGSEDSGADNDVYEIPASVFIVPDEVFDGYVSSAGLKNADAFVMAYVEGIDAVTNKYKKIKILRETASALDLKMLRSIEAPIPEGLSEEELDALIYKKTTIDIGAVVDSLPFAINGYNFGCNITVMVPERCVPRYFAGIEVMNDVYYYFKGKDHNALADKLRDALDKHGLPSENLFDAADYEETNRNMIFIINVFAYGFIVLISLIAAANVFNTISTGINLRRREFAMLKSVGMTQKGFHKMMNYECLMYGTKSLLWGLPAAIGITFLIYRSVNSGYETGFYIPWVSIVVAIFSVFAVVFATMLYSTSKLKNDNIIDALRNENL
ncbi:MAG TPA: ABC transporter permease [Clostridiales bacterium]|nr:ABC transporter permease [Clostridiales bacterium]